MDRRVSLEELARRHGVLAVYLFGSRADDGLEMLDSVAGESWFEDGSDLDVAVAFRADSRPDHRTMADLQVGLEDLFEPLRVDLVRMDRVDALFQFRMIDGHRALATDSTEANELELVVMRRAAELLPIQRRIEQDLFGVSTT